jgi:hypothetical protein
MNYEDCHKIIDERVASLRSQINAVEEVISKYNERLVTLLQFPEEERGEAWKAVFYDDVVSRLNTLHAFKDLLEDRIVETSLQRLDCEMLLDLGIGTGNIA